MQQHFGVFLKSTSLYRSPQDDVQSHLHGVGNKPQKVTDFHHLNGPNYNPFCMPHGLDKDKLHNMFVQWILLLYAQINIFTHKNKGLKFQYILWEMQNQLFLQQAFEAY